MVITARAVTVIIILAATIAVAIYINDLTFECRIKFGLIRNCEEIIINKEEGLELDDDDLEIIRKQRVSGRDFLKMAKEEFIQDGLKRGSVTRLADFAKECKDIKLKAFSSLVQEFERSVEEIWH
ncbi:hypothetical protein RhiirB3_434856 [Rhizophagus irregularis]|nr:hypothetical protein RhiirB3_434856 [Rhizophagus irregularis]